jgi:hypothetical protein
MEMTGWNDPTPQIPPCGPAASSLQEGTGYGLPRPRYAGVATKKMQTNFFAKRPSRVSIFTPRP